MTETFGRYLAESLLGRGAMAEVWRGRDPVLEREVAIKVMRSRSEQPVAVQLEFRERFLREARSAARLVHPSIVAIHDAGLTADGFPFLVMELVDGPSLDAVLASEGPLEPEVAARFGAELARALDCAHRAGIVHRDVKPANALRAAPDLVKLTDFGIARLPESSLTVGGVFLGSPNFASPEQMRGAVALPTSDIFSLALTLYTLLVGENPFARGHLAATAHAVLEEDPPAPSSRRPGLDPAWDRILAHAMAKDPLQRFADAATFAGELEALAAPDLRPVAAPRPPSPPAPELELVVIAGPDRGLRVRLSGAVEIGRGSGVLILTDPSVSTHHSLVEVVDGRVWLRDLGSFNGTFLGDSRVGEAELEEGTVIGLGPSTRIQLVRPGGAPAISTLLDGDSRPAGLPTRPLIPAPRFVLRVQEGPLTGQAFPVLHSLVLGRDDGDVRLDDVKVSRKHALVELRGQSRLMLRDLASTNGTWLGEERVREVELRHGDVFRVGSTVFRVEGPPGRG